MKMKCELLMDGLSNVSHGSYIYVFIYLYINGFYNVSYRKAVVTNPHD